MYYFKTTFITKPALLADMRSVAKAAPKTLPQRFLSFWFDGMYIPFAHTSTHNSLCFV